MADITKYNVTVNVSAQGRLDSDTCMCGEGGKESEGWGVSRGETSVTTFV